MHPPSFRAFCVADRTVDPMGFGSGVGGYTPITTGRREPSMAMNAEEWRWPDELHEPHHGPPLNLLDLATLHRQLAEPDWIALLERTPDRRGRGSPNS